ncbi:MAG: single-stranded-DNA-specific exonuclease RecJ [Candidatus Woesebacteria bacterium]
MMQIGGDIFDKILKKRGLNSESSISDFLHPDYQLSQHDAYLLPDMKTAVDRIILAHKNGECVYIYGDYDIDGLTATTILLESLAKFGLNVDAFIPNRFVDGYGLSKRAIKALAQKGAQLVVTVDCGSLSHSEIDLANELGVDVIVTDHHSVADVMPNAIAIINPKRKDHDYPFVDLAGCGVAFKLVQALQKHLDGLPDGQEKWLLDLVALGTVCDVVTLLGENRANVLWGLKVFAKTRRPGLAALASIIDLDLNKVTAKSLGFGIGPHLNAAGRLKTAQLSLDLLVEKDQKTALQIAQKLHELNIARRTEQDKIAKEASLQAQNYKDDPVLVLSHSSWSHGIIGIVAAKMLEKFKKPTFVLQEIGDETKGSARSYGDFSAVEGIKASEKWLIKGGGHKLAAGVTLRTCNIPNFRQSINEFYKSLKLQDQLAYLKPKADVDLDGFAGLGFDLIKNLAQLEPYGHGNPEPIFCLRRVQIKDRREMGSDNQHLKLIFIDDNKKSFTTVGFNLSSEISAKVGDLVDVWLCLTENEWKGFCSVEGRLLGVEYCKK